MRYRALVVLAALSVSFAVVAAFLPPEQVQEAAKPLPTPPLPAGWELRAWADTYCDRCGKPLTADPRDGCYLINGKTYWLHGNCAWRMAHPGRRYRR